MVLKWSSVVIRLLLGCYALKNSLLAGKIPLIRRVTNFASNPLISCYIFCGKPPDLGQKRDFSLYLAGYGYTPTAGAGLIEPGPIATVTASLAAEGRYRDAKRRPQARDR
jgi:hypothetical protein